MKRLLQTIFVNNLSWFILSPFIWIANRLIASRKHYTDYPKYKAVKEKADAVLNNRCVYDGPFKGMIYQPCANATASSGYAKLLGSYETEIHPFINAILQKQYDAIVNIGCDDGYYAVGLALKMHCPVAAYDISPAAITKTKQLAMQNKADHLSAYEGRFTAQNIIDKYAGKNILYICDCEGGEIDIFTAATAPLLNQSDIIAELHLHIHPEIEQHFRKYFSDTHHISIVNSTPDFIKAATYTHPQITGLDFETRYFITEEREVFMQWIYLEAKKAL